MKTVATSILIACFLVVGAQKLPKALPPDPTPGPLPTSPPQTSSTTPSNTPIDKICSKFELNTKPYYGLCNPPGTHTLSQFSSSTWGTACQPSYPVKSTVSAADIVNILNMHNAARRKIAKGLEPIGTPSGPQPKASNMRELKWDNELACIAAAWAHQCRNKQHDQCRDVSRFKVGQNIFMTVSTSDTLGTADWSLALSGWYSEVQYMNPAYVSSYPASPPNVIGEYTQLVWANTYLIGCATAYYKSTVAYGPKYPYNRIYVCNYGPTGNVIGSPVYAQGAAGSACPAGTTNNDGLCA